MKVRIQPGLMKRLAAMHGEELLDYEDEEVGHSTGCDDGVLNSDQEEKEKEELSSGGQPMDMDTDSIKEQAEEV